MICFPNAKINLGLNVVSRREDGYHNLETVFYPLMIHDALEILVKDDSESDTFVQTGTTIIDDAVNNLVMKALRLMRTQYDFPKVEVYLHKTIPFGAGLGGGSSDASSMLKLLNEAFDLQATDEHLAALAVRLGADCSFFIYNRPLFATGIGEVFENVELSLRGYTFVLVKPNIHVSTKDAFALIEPRKPSMPLTEIIKKPIEDWNGLMHNDFERSVFAQYPEVEHIKRDLHDAGAVYTSMSGSGSSVFGIFAADGGDGFESEGDYSVFRGCFE